MSIRAIAQDLYKAQCEVSDIEKKIDKASAAEKENLKAELKVAQQEHDMIRRMLDGRKESSEFRKKFGGGGLKF